MLFVTVIGHIKVKTSAATPAAENFHVKKEVQDRIPSAAFGVPNVQREAFGASDVAGGGAALRVGFGHCACVSVYLKVRGVVSSGTLYPKTSCASLEFQPESFSPFKSRRQIEEEWPYA